MLSDKRIILGVTGGIAAYKAAFLLRAFQKAGAEVRVTMTPAAHRFVGVDTFASLSKHPVATHIFPENQAAADSWTQHIEWGEWADLFIIAPCTANTIAKIAGGISDNMLTSTVLAARCPLLICPTMDGEMYRAPAVKRNIQTLRDDGYHILEPEEGYLASGLEGKGRLPETEDILDESSAILTRTVSEGPLSGKKVVVTAGPTREFIDPIRFISNPSSGKMGFAMADAAQQLGGEVTVIHGPVQLPKTEGINYIGITSTADLFEEMKHHADADVIIMAAAVSDFTPADYHGQKVKKDEAKETLHLQSTQDILQWLGQHKQEAQTLIGFAMETEDLVKNARQKLKKKNLDWIIANTISAENVGFESDSNTVTVINKQSTESFAGSKKKIAQKILALIFKA
ncbi:bifunctional phosphopantothenoylcysteine decarboxylase/phosphopantothenate--cysteine ligase CoaBC [Fodinibius salsisoli]|uniref:Coenzyme A biosynthesis bifunctional protein CoaBC n=1 Tax=Fodinibius salsisoli TaxID=2820877 RepID=A0ABT3PSM7_9BACT|nr:bifunctional phosphopantothenoylcysteine decarboxylase/phosphopantothenate--cysteine ligase CoaBC [Fodinibius salsisoli]MCW9708867.1 bifunctional phosphopantothenoylcysteine decarboxylase/phosphopantothenate--cysteine ligase CoaBC [Fodinibius salsisoli]